MKIVPIVHTFDNNYVLPAGVAFYSMLKNANPDYFYELYVIHSDVSVESQNKLSNQVNKFKNARIIFIQVSDKDEEYALNIFNKSSASHYSKEIYYRFLYSRMLPNLDKIISTGVDVIYERDISEVFFNSDVSHVYYQASSAIIPQNKIDLIKYFDRYKKDFNDEEQQAILFGAGFCIFNLKKMREDKLDEVFRKYASLHYKKLIQPEQDVMNIVCYPKISINPIWVMVCTYMLEQERATGNWFYSYYNRYCTNKEIIDIFTNPLQIHFAGTKKPWKCISMTKADAWFKYLFESDFAIDYVFSLGMKITSLEEKILNNESLLAKLNNDKWIVFSKNSIKYKCIFLIKQTIKFLLKSIRHSR